MSNKSEFNTKYLFVGLARRGFLDWMSDSVYLKIIYRLTMHKKLNLKNPCTFNEKLQWLKLHDRKDEYINWVDKIASKEIVASKFGSQYVVPLISVWDRVEEIDFDLLPDKFVLKCSHDQGSVVLCDKTKGVDEVKIRRFLQKHLKLDIYRGTREWPYKGVKPRILCEEFLEDNIIDYKVYCFNGEPRFLYVGQGLTEDHSLKIDFFDLDWKPMPFYRTDYNRLDFKLPQPVLFDEMIQLAKKMSQGTQFVRIDLFEVKGKIYFSEFSLYPGSGYMPFVPENYDEIVGSWLQIN